MVDIARNHYSLRSRLLGRDLVQSPSGKEAKHAITRLYRSFRIRKNQRARRLSDIRKINEAPNRRPVVMRPGKIALTVYCSPTAGYKRYEIIRRGVLGGKMTGYFTEFLKKRFSSTALLIHIPASAMSYQISSLNISAPRLLDDIFQGFVFILPPRNRRGD